MAGRTVSRNRSNRRCIRLVLLVVIILAVLAVKEGCRLYVRNQEYTQMCRELEDKIAAEEERGQKLQEYQEYVETDEFAEWYAKEHLGLVRDNWIQFKSE